MKRKSKRDGPVRVQCLACTWHGEDRSWRKAKRLLMAHTRAKHGGKKVEV